MTTFKGDFVQITSMMDITVTPGLQFTDFTRKESDLPNRLRVGVEWTKAPVLVRKGVGVYPAIITTWPTVKALVENKVFSITEVVDEKDITSEVRAEKAKLDRVEPELKRAEAAEKKAKKTRGSAPSLDDIAGE